jgi:hypothetical protein
MTARCGAQKCQSFVEWIVIEITVIHTELPEYRGSFRTVPMVAVIEKDFPTIIVRIVDEITKIQNQNVIAIHKTV